MSYQVLARKWRPQRFDEVVGQRGVTETLRNAIGSGRIAQSYIFAGARGVGKTTTARILAKALNCVSGPTTDPCGRCDACVEIAEGRDIDVIEIDAATHTQVDTVREVIIEGLAVRPVRDRYKIFIIDEVHQLSSHSFNALLKSIEEPPPHVVFMMATTELHKIPDTIRSRSQEFEFRTIATKAIVDQLAKIAASEGLDIEPAALQLVGRAAEGSLRDAESALDQVIAFAGTRITADDVVTVLGLVGRDLLLDIVETVADEDAARVFDVANRAAEAGLDLRLLCRELTHVVRDMMVLSVDPARADDPEFAPDGDLSRLQTLAGRFSREDLLRSFDVLARAEFEIRNAAQPRYHLEMALLRWMQLRKIVPLATLIQALESGDPLPAAGARQGSEMPSRAAAEKRPAPRSAVPAAGVPGQSATVRRVAEELRKPTPASAPREATPTAGPPPAPSPPDAAPEVPVSEASAEADEKVPEGAAAAADLGGFVRAFEDEVKQANKVLHGTVVAQARRIEFDGSTLTFVFTPRHKVLRAQVEQKRAWIEDVARRLAGRPVTLATLEEDGPSGPEQKESPKAAKADGDRLKARAMDKTAVQAMLDVFPAKITGVEEL